MQGNTGFCFYENNIMTLTVAGWLALVAAAQKSRSAVKRKKDTRRGTTEKDAGAEKNQYVDTGPGENVVLNIIYQVYQ